MAKKTDEIFKKQTVVSSSVIMHKEVQKELLVIICDSIMNEDVIIEWTKKLWSFQEAYAKILYSELSTFILDEKKDETIRILKDNLSKISSFMDREYSKIDIEQYRFWLKYKDHCELAILQRKHYHMSIDEIEEKAKTTALASVKEETDKIQKDLTSQLIGLVSIFTALSFVIFGGINILNSVLQNVRLASISRLLCVGILWTICMSILFYIFVRFILKIIKPMEEKVFSDDFMKIFKGLMIGLFVLLIGTVLLDMFYYNPKKDFKEEQKTEIVVQPEEVIIYDLDE